MATKKKKNPRRRRSKEEEKRKHNNQQLQDDRGLEERKRKHNNQQLQEMAKTLENQKHNRLIEVLQKQKVFNKTFFNCIRFYGTSLVERLKMNAYLLNIISEMAKCKANNVEFTGHEFLDDNGINRYISLLFAKEYCEEIDEETGEYFCYVMRDHDINKRDHDTEGDTENHFIAAILGFSSTI